MFLLKGLEYLWMLVFIMITAGIAKEQNLFASAFAYIQENFTDGDASNLYIAVETFQTTLGRNYY